MRREGSGSSLTKLKRGGATSRVLDLYSVVVEMSDDDPSLLAKPFFQHPLLNRSFFIKHTLRSHERELVDTHNSVVTKVILPISDEDLSMGGHSIFVEEIDFENKLARFLEQSHLDTTFIQDFERIHELAHLPSFDPFLLAERFGRASPPVSPSYFRISLDERKRMEGYVAKQIGSVVQLAFDDARGQDNARRAQKFAKLLVSGEDKDRLVFLQAALGLSPDEYDRGVFGWKGLLYYHWSIQNARDGLERFLKTFSKVLILGATTDEKTYIDETRRRIIEEAQARWRSLSLIINEYDREFQEFCRSSRPAILKRFLLRAPSLFEDLGSDLSAVNHVTSYWFFWMKNKDNRAMPARDAIELFPDFLSSIARPDQADDEERWSA